MTETMTQTICAALREADIPAVPEFLPGTRPVPEGRCFVTAAIVKAALASGGGTVTLRIRLHRRTDVCAAETFGRADAVIRNALSGLNCAVFSVTRGELQYLRSIDRMMLETLWVIGAVCRQDADETVLLPDQALTLTLGSLTLTAEEFTCKTEVPVIRQTLCGGETHITLLAETPCTLTVSGKTAAADFPAAAAALDAALRAHTAFDFTFAGMEFSGMQLLSVNWKKHTGAAEFAVMMIGGTGA